MAAMMSQAFEHRWRGELAVLEALFGKEKVKRDLPRVKEIHEYTELKWNEYADQLRDRVVRYLLIGEAPPWSPEGIPQFLLDPKSSSANAYASFAQSVPNLRGPIVWRLSQNVRRARVLARRFNSVRDGLFD